MSEYPQPPPEERTESIEERNNRLNKEFRELFTKYIETKWKTVFCPVCGTGDWTSRNPVEASLWIGDRRIFIYVPVFCENCGYTLFFDALAAGLVDAEGNPRDPVAESQEKDSEPEEPKAGD
jgi:predicted nucleic-acid-binding Zn-ribbon protein